MRGDSMHLLEVTVAVLVVGFPVLLGFGSIYAGFTRWWQAKQLASSRRRATAVVVGSGADGDGFLPVVSFTTEGGREVRTIVKDMRSQRTYPAGTQLPIAYDPADPRRALSLSSRMGGLVFSLLLAVVFFGFAVVAYRIAGPLIPDH